MYHTVSIYSLVAVDCGPLSVPINGSSYGDSTVFPNSMLFKCDPGFHLNGSSTRICQANGTWSGLAVRCVGMLLAKGQRSCRTLQYRRFSLDWICRRPAFYGIDYPSREQHVFFFLSTYFHYPARHHFTFNPHCFNFCSAKDCGPLAVPTNGSSTGDLTVFPNRMLFSCDEGFLLRGSDVRHCQANGNWSGNQTFCKGSRCFHFIHWHAVGYVRLQSAEVKKFIFIRR